MTLKTTFDVLREAVREFGRDGATVLGAALSFYTALSLAPLLVILMFVAGVIGIAAQQQLIMQIVGLIGPQAGAIIQLVLQNISLEHQKGLISAILGITALLSSAMAVFGQLQTSMNIIWNVEARPGRGAFRRWLRKRLLSLGMMAGVGFLLLVSLAISTALTLVFSGEGTAWKIVDLGVSLIIYALLFATIFKVLPDISIAWRDVWLGAVITAVLFDVGKFAIGKYLGYSSVGSAYGAAGSLVVLLLWVYYSSLIMFLGAELAQVIAHHRGARRAPEKFAREGIPKS
jgi:membrane protein